MPPSVTGVLRRWARMNWSSCVSRSAWFCRWRKPPRRRSWIPRRYGIVLATEDGRRGILLPNVEGIETIEQQIEAARHKGGIDELEPVRIQRFAVKKFREADRN